MSLVELRRRLRERVATSRTLPEKDLPVDREQILAGVRSPGLRAELERLDGLQLAAVTAAERAVVVRAPVGSGKTRVLTARLGFLVEELGVPPERIVVLTFTRRAAREAAERILAAGRGVEARIGTFHGVARQLLEHELPVHEAGWRPGFEIIDDRELDALRRRLVEDHGLDIKYSKRLARRVEAFHEHQRVLFGSMRRPDDLPKLMELEEQEKRALNVMTFGDLVSVATELLRAHPGVVPVDWILVDELQDLSPGQLDFIEALGPRGGLFAVGDPGQAIYGWRGGSASVFDQVASGWHARILTLANNYRSTGAIVRSTAGLLRDQAGVAASTTRPDGEPVLVVRYRDQAQEARWVRHRVQQLLAGGASPGEVAILFRTWRQAEPIMAELGASGVPVETRPMDADAQARVVVSTFHGVKGLEFRHVFVVGVNEGLVPLAGSFSSHGALAEETRLLYVAMTRARDGLEVSFWEATDLPRVRPGPSPLLSSLPSSLVRWVDRTSSPLGMGPPAGSRSRDRRDQAPAGRLFEEGATVSHRKYGTGVVVEVTSTRLTCRFPGHGVKTFDPRFF